MPTEEHATGAIGFDGLAVLLVGQGGLEGEMANRLAAPGPRGTTPDLHRAVLVDFLASVQDGRGPPWTARLRSGSSG